MSVLHETGEFEDYALLAKLDNAKSLATLLKAIHFKDIATVFISSNGLKVTVEDAKCMQASAFIQSSVFQEFTFKEESASFRINLTVWIECMNIFGSSKESGSVTAVKMCYGGLGCPLKLLLVEDGILTDCSIKTQEPEDIVDFNFSSESVVNKVIMKSICLKDAFQELDMTSDVIQIHVSPASPYFRLSTFGHSGSAHVDYARDSEMVETFECQRTQSNRYRTVLMKHSTKALVVSSKISIRMDLRGFLSMQYMVVGDDGQVCFVEYLYSPDEDVEADEEVDEFS